MNPDAIRDIGGLVIGTGIVAGGIALITWALRRSRQPTASLGAVETTRNAVEESMHDFGLTQTVGDELRMGWYEHIFAVNPPVAGVREVWTLHGRLMFTGANRCVVITDGQRLVLLDRERNHGVRLDIRESQWFEAVVHDNAVGITLYKAHGGKNVAGRYTIEAHVDDARLLVPHGWPGKSTVLPQPPAAA